MIGSPSNHFFFTNQEVEIIKKFVLIAIENGQSLDEMFPGQDRLAQEAAFLYLLITNPQAEWIFGTSPDPKDARDVLVSDVIPEPQTVTTSFVDLSPYCSPIENQGSIGSCSAHATIGSVELLEKRSGRRVDRSRLFLYYNSRALMNTINEDSGCYLRDVLKACQTYGICQEDLWPYDLSKWKEKPSKPSYDDALGFKITKYASLNDGNVQEACAMLCKGLPVLFGAYCFSSITSPEAMKTGIIQMPSVNEKSDGAHALLLVGFDVEKGYFKFRNSWGAAWGDNGYGFLSFDYYAKYTFSPWTILGLG